MVIDSQHPKLQQLDTVQRAIEGALEDGVEQITISKSNYEEIQETFLTIAEQQGETNGYDGRELAVKKDKRRVVVSLEKAVAA